MKIFQQIIIFALFLLPFNFASANAVDINKGNILLQKDVRMAWYVNPSTMLRHPLGNPIDVLKIIQKLGLGISNKDFSYFNNTAPKRLAGKILIKVEDSGKAYYVSPKDLKIHFLGKPNNALFVMRELGVSINDSDLKKITKISDKKNTTYKAQSSATSNLNKKSDQKLTNLKNTEEFVFNKEGKSYTSGIYLTATTFKNLDIDAFIERNRESPMNTLVVDLAGFGFLKYKEKKPSQVIVDKIQKIREAGFYFIARVVTLKNTELARISPLKTKSGDVWDGVWVDASTKEIKDYYVDIAKRLAKIGVDEVQLDYIRFPTSFFSKQTPSTLEERTQIITNLVKTVYAQTQKDGIKLSVDIFGILAWNEADNVKRLGQDTREIVKYVDYISPMIYPSHFGEGFGGFVRYNDPYTTIKVSTKKFIDLIGQENKHKLRPWLQGFSYRAPNFNANYIYAQVKAVADLGVNDFLIWNASNWYTHTHAMFSYLKNDNGEVK